jgi:hypothetical protein
MSMLEPQAAHNISLIQSIGMFPSLAVCPLNDNQELIGW